MKYYMKNIFSFKEYATSIWTPYYFREYVNSLSDERLECFYNQVKEVLEFLTDEAYFIYKFKWIKDRNFTDLSKEIYLESLYNPELFTFDIIKPEYASILDEKYRNDGDVLRFYGDS